MPRDLSAAGPIAELESYVESIRGAPEEGLGLWYAALARYREAWTSEKVAFEERRPHLEKAIAWLGRLEEPAFDGMFIAKDKWFTSQGRAPIAQLLEQARADLAWAREHDRPEPAPEAKPGSGSGSGTFTESFPSSAAMTSISTFTNGEPACPSSP